MGRIIKTVIEIDEEDFMEYVENEGGTYDENCLWEDLNGALDSLPFCTNVVGYNIYGEYDDEDEE